MKDVAAAIARHWAPKGDLAAIEAQLRRAGRDPAHPTLEDLAAVDQLHAGQLRATGELARWVEVPRGAGVLDVGAGLGGSARYLASEHDCIVTALELSVDLHRTGQELTRRMGLEDRVIHRCGDVEQLSGADPHDLVWLQHVDMHVLDKRRLYGSCRAVLPPATGRVVWQDWLAGPGGPPTYPVPWSSDGAISFLVDEGELRAALASSGLELTRFQPVPGRTRAWFQASHDGVSKVLRKADATGRERLEGLLAELTGVLESLDGDRLIPFFGEAKPAPVR